MAVHEVEVWVLIDESGNYVVAANSEDLATKYDEEVGEGAEMSRRAICVKLKVPLESYVTLTGEVPAEGTASLFLT